MTMHTASDTAFSSNPLKLRVGASVWNRWQAHHLAQGKRVESLSYAFAHASVLPGSTIVCIGDTNPVIMLAPDCFERRSGGALRLRGSVLNGLLVEFARSSFNCLVNIHDHWFANVPRFSAIDDADDLSFDRYLRERFEPMLKSRPDIGPDRPIFNLSVVLGQQGLDARMVAVGQPTHGACFAPAVRAAAMGANWLPLQLPHQSPAVPHGEAEAVTALHLRHQDFLTGADRERLAGLSVGVAGCGGLGSILAEALARMGVGRLALVDDDKLDLSNLNRWQGGRLQDVGLSKAGLLAKQIRAMCLGTKVEAVELPIYSDDAKAALAGADIMVGGLDNDEARWFLNKLSLQYLVPYFDAGVKVESAGAVDFKSRYFAVLPGTSSCLDCNGFTLFDRQRTLQAYMNPALAQERRAAGYVEQAPETKAPSVYPLNLQAAGTLMTEFVNFVTGWRPTATVSSTSWRNGVKRADRANFPEPAGEECPCCSHLLAAGSSEPLARPCTQSAVSADGLCPNSI